MERRVDVSEEYVQLDSLLFITCPILSRLRDLLDDPRTRVIVRLLWHGVINVNDKTGPEVINRGYLLF